ncbi:hypothetical protein ABW20_dc0106034 [Dactylellina cionopaga]|nr:hypothetical protein ABW20_dc0106034 [Dactylellina cionopaga]
MKDPEKATEKKNEIKKQMIRRSRRRKKNQDPNKPQLPSQKPRGPVKPPTPPTTNIVGNEGIYTQSNQFPAISLPTSLGDHDFSRFSTSSPEDSGAMEFSPFNMRGMQWAVNLPSARTQRQSHTLSPPTTCTFPSRESTVEETIKEEEEDEIQDEDMDIPDLEDADSSSPTEIVRYRSHRPSIPSFSFPDLQIPTENKLDINLANLYLRTIFGVTYRALSDEQVVQYNDALIVPMFNDNKSFLHGCLSSTALHLTATNISETQRKGLVTEVFRHRQKSLKSLKQQVARSGDSDERIKIAATVCALISFEVFSRKTDWQVHVKAATDCVILLNWCQQRPIHPGQWFIYSRILWLDILSSMTTENRPAFSDFYHQILFLQPEKRNQVNRLIEMTGCDDSVLYIISEITCLERWKFENLSSQPWPILNAELTRQGLVLDRELKRLATTDLSSRSPRSATSPSDYKYWNYNSVHTSPQMGEMDFSGSDFGDDTDVDSDFDGEDDDVSYVDEDPSQEIKEVVDGIVRRNSSFTGLDNHVKADPTSPTNTEGGDVFVPESTNKLIEDRGTFRKAVTEAFRIMARAYLRIVVYGFNPYDVEAQDLLQEFLAVINFIPSLYMGYERSIISPLLVVGSLAIHPHHQQIISTRLKRTPHMAKYGNLGNVDKILTEIWSRQWAQCSQQVAPWRQVMKEKNWEYLMV